MRLLKIAGLLRCKQLTLNSHGDLLPLSWPEYICPPWTNAAEETGRAQQKKFDVPATNLELERAQVHAPHCTEHRWC